MAMFIKGLENENLDDMLRYYRIQLAKLGVTVNLGQAVTSSLVDQVKPDAVVVAAGGSYAVPEIPGIIEQQVETAMTPWPPDGLGCPPPREVNRMAFVGEVLGEKDVLEFVEMLGANRAAGHRFIRHTH